MAPPSSLGCVQVLMAGGNIPLASRAVTATTFAARLKGLLGRPGLPEGEAMIFERCRSIHTIGMRFRIDAVFVDRAWHVVALRCDLGPGQVVAPVRGAWGVIETASGMVARLGLQVGDQLRIVTG